MAKAACLGAAFVIDLKNDRKPPHYWVIVTDPDHNGDFVVASLTDARNYTANDEIWHAGCHLTSDLRLSKDSVIHMRFVQVANQDWLDDNGTKYIGQATAEALRLFQCNMVWFEEQLQPAPLAILKPFLPGWEGKCYQ